MRTKLLPGEEVTRVIERKSSDSIPIARSLWWGEGLVEKYGDRLKLLEETYSDDVAEIWYKEPTWSFSGSPINEKVTGYDEIVLLPDWSRLEDYLAEMPSPDEPGIFDNLDRCISEYKKTNRCVLGCWWFSFFERFWSIRGMSNTLVDFIEMPHKFLKLGKALLDYYKGIVRHYATLGCNGIWTSDDFGSQRSLLMSPDTFRMLLKPLHKSLAEEIHKYRMHYWLHACGNIMEIIPDLIDCGVDVLHPIQAGTMDERFLVKEYGKYITFFAGIDVQHLLASEYPQMVRQDIQKWIGIFKRPEGSFIIGAGNGITGSVPFENIEAYLDEINRR